MDSVERIKTILRGDTPDRTPISAWTHFPLVDHYPERLARRTISFTKANKLDVCKISYYGNFYNEAMGNEFIRSYNPNLSYGETTKYAVHHPIDYLNLKKPSLNCKPLKIALEATKYILDSLKNEVVLVASIGSPTTIASSIYTPRNHPEYFVRALKTNPKEVKEGLDIITDSILEFVDELIRLGIDGVFYSDIYASKKLMNTDLHDNFCKPCDLKILNKISEKTWFNIMHACGNVDIRIDEYEKCKYPVDAYNWESENKSDHSTTSDKARELTKKILMTGIDYNEDLNIYDVDKVSLRLKGKYAIQKQNIGDNKFIFAPGCSVKTGTPEDLFFEIYNTISNFY